MIDVTFSSITNRPPLSTLVEYMTTHYPQNEEDKDD